MHRISDTITKINELVPDGIKPIILAVSVSTINIEFFLKIISISLSIGYLVYKWRLDILNNRKKKK